MSMTDLEKLSTDVPTLDGLIEKTSAPIPTPTPPSSRSQAWLTVLGAFLAMFAGFGQMNSIGTYQTWYKHHQLAQLPSSTIAWIGSTQLLLFFLSGGPIGRCFDAYGPKRLMSVGMLVCLVGIMLQSVSTQLYAYVLCQGVLFGLGVGLLFYPVMAAVSTHFTRYRATALGIAASGSSVGGVVWPILMQRLFVRVGFGWAVRASGLLTVVLSLLSIMMVTRVPNQRRPGAPWVDTQNFKDARFTLLAGGSFFVALGLFTPFFFIVDYANSIGIVSPTSFYVLAAMNAGGFFGRIAPAILSDRLGRFNTLVPSAFICGLLILAAWPFVHTSGVIGVCFWAAAYGFSSGAFVSLITPCVAQISEVSEIGTRIGMLYSLIAIPALVGGPIAGALIRAGQHSYMGMMVFAGSTLVVGSFLLLAAKLRIDSRLFSRT